MSDSDNKQEPSAIPSWQRSAQSETSPTPATEDKLEVARRFLDDEVVRDASREKKIEFLKSKDIADEEIRELLGEEEGAAAVAHGDSPEQSQQQADAPASSEASEASDEIREIIPTMPSTAAAPTPATAPTTTSTTTPSTASSPPETSSFLLPYTDRPPIVTYPEFLAKPVRPSPLVTRTALANTLYAFAGLSTLVYGCSKYILAPMLESQTQARQDLHAATAAKLDAIVAKLETTVSEIPPRKMDDVDSEAEDPTELFHRDMGTQTTSPLPPAALENGKEPATAKQAGQLEGISKKLTNLRNEVRAQSEDMEDIKTLVDTFRDELDSMTYPGQGEYLAGYDIYGRTRKQDPDDEIKKVRDNIRRVKGVLLSTRNFPASAR